MKQARGALCCLGIIGAVVFFLLYPTSGFSAADIAVSNGGTNTGSCGDGVNPACKTIGYAVGTRAVSGDTVKPKAGTYNAANGETFPINVVNGVSIVGDVATPANVVVNAGGLSTVFLTNGPLNSSTVISGLSIEPGGTNTGTGLRIYANTGVAITAVIEHNRFVGGGRGINALNDMGGIGVNLSPTIRLNSFGGQHGDAIHFEMADSGSSQFMSPVITGNTITNARTAIQMRVRDSAEGVISPLIASNTIVSPGGGIELEVSELSDNPDANITFSPTIRNNTITGPEGDAIQVVLADVEHATNAVIKFNPTINNNTITGPTDDDGIQVAIAPFWDSVTSLSLSANITINNNTISGMGYEGIRLSISDLSEMTNGKAVIAATVAGNTVADNGGDGIIAEARNINGNVAGFNFSPTVKNNTVSGNGSIGSGIDIAYTDSGAGGTALVSGNQVTNNSGTGVSIEIRNQNFEGEPISPVPAKVALRNNTISGNDGDAVKVFGGSTEGGGDQPAAGNYAVDLGGGFLGGNGKNVILGNTGSGYFDINNDGPNDVAALCNDFTAADATEEDFLDDHNDDPARGYIKPILICQPPPCVVDADCSCGPEADCIDEDPSTCGVCNPVTHLCVYYSEGGCNDFNSCTTDDQCSNGVCAGTPVKDGTKCDDGHDCTVNDMCTGGVCAGTFAGTDVVCRPAVNQCDVAEYCTETDKDCPPDQKVPDTTPCDDGYDCTINDMCTAGVCAGTRGGTDVVCRPAAGACDLAENCNGTDPDCPADVFAAAGTVCRPAANSCDVPEECTGTSASCPTDIVQPPGTACTPVGSQCPGICAGGVPELAFVGFTAATGGNSENHDIMSWTFGSTINYADFSSIAGLTLLGNAAQVGTVLRLTSDAAGQDGAAWFNTQQVVQTGFDTTFQFRITPSGADGFAFVIQNSPAGTSAIGCYGGGIGYAANIAHNCSDAIPNSLAVEFDTYNNGEFQTPHVSVQTLGSAPNSYFDSASLGHYYFPAMTDGNLHTVRITYVPGTMNIFLDGATTANLSVSVNLASLGLNNSISDCAPACDDGDGVPAPVEDAGPNSGDGNNDGIKDSKQGWVASFPAWGGRGYVTLVLSSNDPDPGCHQLLNVSASPVFPGQDPGFTYPFGMVTFQVNCADSITVTFIMHGTTGSMPSMTYRVFGPVAPNFAGPDLFYTLPGAVFGTMNIPGEGTVRTATFTLTDQRLGDGSGIVGTIIDPSGPAIPSSQGVAPAMSFGGLVALAALLGVVAWFGLRNRRRGVEPST